MYHRLSLCHLLATLLLAAAVYPKLKCLLAVTVPAQECAAEAQTKSLEAAAARLQPLPVDFRRSRIEFETICAKARNILPFSFHPGIKKKLHRNVKVKQHKTVQRAAHLALW